MQDIIFDLDGTLWDTRQSVLQNWIKCLKIDKNVLPEDFVTQVMGLNLYEIYQKLQEYASNISLKSFNKCCNKENKYIRQNGAIIYDDVIQCIKTLSLNYNLYIVSGCQKGYIDVFLKITKLKKYFKDYDFVGNKFENKYECLNHFIDANKIESCIYVGDTVHDKLACEKLSNCQFVYAKYGFGEFEYQPSINKLVDLEPLLRRF